MKNLEERMAEINRRSEERIRKRNRRRRQMLMLCIPLVLCIGITALLNLPNRTDKGFSGGGYKEDVDMNSQVCSYVQAEIYRGENEEQLKIVIDKVEVTKLYCAVAFPENYGVSGTVGGNESANGPSGTKDEVTDAVRVQTYTIVFSTEEGDESTYSLYGNVVSWEDTGWEQTLSKERLAKLKLILGS